MGRLRVVPVLLFLMAMTPLGMSPGSKDKASSAPAHTTHLIVSEADVKWEAPPAAMFTGTPSVEGGSPLRYARLSGDPMKPGAPFTIELGCSDGFKAAPHWHPTDENLVVLKGTFAVSTGDVYNPATLHDMSTGTYALMNKRVHHFALCKGDTLVLIYGTGPFHVNWLGPPVAAKKKPAAD
jgi:hypothetical protein